MKDCKHCYNAFTKHKMPCSCTCHRPASDRLTPKEIKAWCEKTLLRFCDKPSDGWASDLTHYDVIDLMYKSYKRGYQDALGG